MKDQINKYARGVFEYDPPVIRAKESSVYSVVDKNRSYKGTISLYEEQGREIKGIIYTDNDKVVLPVKSFCKDKVALEYSVRCDGALNGEVIEGVFNVVSNGGELSIPYSFKVEAGSYDTSAGVIRNLTQFVSLAQNNEEEAVKLFETPDFKEILLGEDINLQCLYKGISKGTDSHNNMEEFLVAAHKKNQVHISLMRNGIRYDNISESFKDSVIVERDGWGYISIDISTDSQFIRPERTELYGEMFAGNRYEFSYIIDYDKLHAGINCGRICFTTCGKKTVYEITVKKDIENDTTISSHELKQIDYQLMKEYIDFRTHRTSVSRWVIITKDLLEKILDREDVSVFYKLALAQIYITENEDDKAKEIIENAKVEIDINDPSQAALYCYFIYINTLYNKDRAYSKKSAAIVKAKYDECKDWRILWTLLFMDEELENNASLKLLRIKEQFNKGCTSPAMYIEACNVLNEHPMLLRVINSFEMNVLLFGAAHGILSDKIIELIIEMVMGTRVGTERFLRLLMIIYEDKKDTLVLECLCKTLIRNNRIGNKYLPYYEEGIRKELKITQLFEYDIASRDLEDMTPMPKMLLLYFGYNNHLDYNRKAYLYENIMYNKTNYPQVFKSYLPQIEHFVKEQLMAGHINSQLAFLYRNIVTADMINEENAAAVSEIYHTYKIQCTSPIARSVIIRQKESNSEKEYPLVNSVAYVKMYTEDAGIFITSGTGNRYCAGIPFSVERLIEDDAIVNACLSKDDSLIHIKLSMCEKYIKYRRKTLNAVGNLTDMSKMPEINGYYRNLLISSIIEYYYDSYDSEGFEEFIKDVDLDKLEEKDITRVIEIYIIQGEYETAFELIKKSSGMGLIPKRLLKLCSKLAGDGEHNDSPELIRLCFYCFKEKQTDENVLGYMIKYYNGTTLDMIEVWSAAKRAGLDTYELEERIIAQMLFVHMKDENEDIFESYYAKGPNERLVEAYLAYHSYMYFVKQRTVSENIFDMIEATLENEKPLALVCRMALLHHYTCMESLTEFRKVLAEKILEELVRKEYVFPFFNHFVGIVKMPFTVVDKTMVEYRSHPDQRVIIHYVVEDQNHHKQYVSEDMKNTYEGIFVKQFVLFYGEKLQYYISKEVDGKEVCTEKCIIENNKIRPDKSESRYEALNDVIAGRTMHDAETVRKLVHTYAVTENLTNEIFKPF